VYLDRSWYLDVNNFARDTPWLHAVMAAYALWAGLMILAALLLAAYLVVRRGPDAPRRAAAVVCGGLGVVVALLVNQHVISPLVGRARPCHTIAHVEVLLTCANDYSFPSDHTMLAGAFTAALAFVGLRWAVQAAFLALLLAFGRVYTGVHYPSDAAAGLVIGAAIGAIVVAMLRPAAGRLFERLAGGKLRPFVGGS
jgi:undecaprenyl-diphosphatase